MTESNNILITGFGPFGEHNINASWEAVSNLPDEINGFKILKEKIPVAYEHVETNVPLMWQLYNPKLVIHVGVSSYTGTIQIETCAHRAGYERKDIENKCPENGTAKCGNGDGHDYIQTNLCAEIICEKLNEFPTLKATVSNDPGRFLERRQPDKRIFSKLKSNLIKHGSFNKPRPKIYNKENRDAEEINVLAVVGANPIPAGLYKVKYLCEFIYYTSLNINNNGTLFVHVPPLDKPFTKKQLAYALEEIIKCALGLIAKNEQNFTCFPTKPAKIYKNGRAVAF